MAEPQPYSMPRVYDQEGRVIPEDQAGAAIAAGQAMVEPGQVFNVRNASGQLVGVRSEDLGSYLASQGGATLESSGEAAQRRYREEATTADAFVAAGEGALDTLSFGVSQPLLESLSRDGLLPEGYRESSAARAQEFERARLIGQVAGAVTPWGVEAAGARAPGLLRAATAPSRLVTRGATRAGEAAAALVGRGAPGVGRRLLARAAGGAVEGAVEGAAYGAGSYLGEAAFSDTEFDAEALLASIGEGASAGALWGGTLGGGFAAAGEAARGVSRAVRPVAGAAGDAVSSLLGRAGGEGLSESLRRTLAEQADMSALKGVGAYGSDLQAVARAKGDDMLARLAERVRNDPELGTMRSLREHAETLARQKDAAGRAIGAVVDEAGEAGVRVDLPALVRRLDEDVVGPLRSSNVQAEREIGKRLIKETQKLRDDLQADAMFRETGGVEGAPLPEYSLGDLRKMRQAIWDSLPRNRDLWKSKHYARARLASAIESEVNLHIGGASEELAERYRLAKRDFEDLVQLEKIASDRAATRGGNRFVSLTDTISGASGLAAGATAMMSPTLAAAGVAANMALRDTRTALGLSRVVSRQLRDRASATNRALAAIDRLSSRTSSAARSAADAVTSARRQIPQAPAQRRSVLRPIALGGRIAASYEAAASDASRWRLDQQSVIADLERETEGLRGVSPQLAGTLVAAKARGLQYLADVAPQPLPGAVPGVQSPVSESRKSEFVARARAVQDPSTALQDLADLKLRPEAVEAIRAVYPRLYGRMVAELEAQLTERAARGSYPSYQGALQLSTFTGRPVVPAQAPQAIQAQQAMWATAPEEPGAQQAQVSRSTSAATNMGQRDMLASDRLEI